jgi:putative transposase
MPRAARVLIDGGVYHILTRGNNAQPVFHAEADLQYFTRLLAIHLPEHQIRLFHYVLMPNHVHLVLQPASGPALSRAMLSINLAYTLYHRARYQYSGHLWQGRFKSLLIDHDSYLLECGRYVELNPVRAGLTVSPGAYAWSSHRAYADGVSMAHVALADHPLYAALGNSPLERQQRYREFVQEGLRPHEAVWAPWMHSRRRAGRKSFPRPLLSRSLLSMPRP